MSISLEARDILMQLNSMGYRNITAEQLKEFIKDLKRLIKYESKYSNLEEAINKLSNNAPQSQQTNEVINTFDKLHITSTTASRARCSARNNPPTHQIISRESSANKENRAAVPVKKVPEPLPIPVRKVLRKPTFINTGTQSNIPDIETAATKSTRSSAKSTISNVQPCIRNTPTDLYQNYQKDWNRFKTCLPGENSRSNVRLAIRKKMERKPQPNTKLYLVVNEDQTKVFKRM